MKQYRLLKDLPTFKAGQLAYISKTGNLIAGTPENQKTTETGLIIMIQPHLSAIGRSVELYL